MILKAKIIRIELIHKKTPQGKEIIYEESPLWSRYDHSIVSNEP